MWVLQFMPIVVFCSAALDKHEKIGKYGFTSLGITEVHMYIYMCVYYIYLCSIAMILY